MEFKISETLIPEVIIIEPKIIEDDRGFFMETYKHSEFESIGIESTFFQDNHSKSKKGVLRGMHYQKPPKGQAKLVRVLSGEIFDVAVIGIPNDLFGQSPVAFVVPNNEITSTQIINNCSKKLERYKIPIKILFLDEIPKTDSGKIKRNTLRAKFD